MVDITKDSIFRIKEGFELEYINNYLNEQEKLFPYPEGTRIQEHNWWIERLRRLIWTAQSDLETLKMVEEVDREHREKNKSIKSS